MTMAGVGGFRAANPSSGINKTLERALEESVLTGEILLCGRKIRDYPKSAINYNLGDTVNAGEHSNTI